MDRQTIFGLEKIKLDLLFILAGGEKVEKNFSYPQQRNFYIKEIFGNNGNETEIISYGKQPHKLVYSYMFPNNPAGVRSFKLLVSVFAGQFLLRKMFEANDFETVTEEIFSLNICENAHHFSKSYLEDIFSREIEILHRQYIKDFSGEDYKQFQNLMNKFSAQFFTVAEAVENFVMQEKPTEITAEKPVEIKTFSVLERLKIDLLFILAGGEKVEKNFSYDQQRNFYIKEIFGNTGNETEIISYGKKYKLFTEYMFPNKPANINNRKYFFELFANCVYFNQIFLANSYNAFQNQIQFQNFCFDEFKYPDNDAEEIFKNEIRNLINKYSHSIGAEEYKIFLGLIKKFYVPFSKILNTLKANVAAKISFMGAEKTDFFSAICKKLAVPAEDIVIFKLKIDALAEIQIGNSTYVEYFESLKKGWKEKFPRYDYCEELENYIKQEKAACLSAFGNKLSSIRIENDLFELLATVTVKLALSDGAANLEELQKFLAQKAENFSYDELKNIFIESTKKVIVGYSLNDNANYNSKIKAELVPYRADLLYVEEILMEEINRRDKKNSGANQPRPNFEQSAESETAKYKKKYDLIISQKDAEIDELKRDLEYYSNIKSQEFRNDYSGYDSALMTLFQRMCENRYGAPLNELYLLSLTETEIKLSTIQNIVKNLLFIFDSMGINPYEIKNIGKTIKFDSDDANVVYTVKESEITEGINKGILKYPGWELRGKEIVLPLVVMENGGDSDE